MNWKKITLNVVGTTVAGVGLANILAGIDWLSIAGIIFACASNIIGLLQQPPQDENKDWRIP